MWRRGSVPRRRGRLTLPTYGGGISAGIATIRTSMADMDELMNAEFKEAFDEFDKVGIPIVI